LPTRVHPPVRFTPLQRLRFAACPVPPGTERLPGGSLSLFATSADSIVGPGSHTQHLPSSTFLTPSRVCSASGLAGLFHPAATFRVLPRETPTRTGSTPRRRQVALSSLATVCCRRLPVGSTSNRTALRAFLCTRVPVPKLRCLAATSALSLVGPSSSRFLPLVEVRAPSRPFRSWPSRKTRRCRALR